MGSSHVLPQPLPAATVPNALGASSHLALIVADLIPLCLPYLPWHTINLVLLIREALPYTVQPIPKANPPMATDNKFDIPDGAHARSGVSVYFIPSCQPDVYDNVIFNVKINLVIYDIVISSIKVKLVKVQPVQPVRVPYAPYGARRTTDRSGP